MGGELLPPMESGRMALYSFVFVSSKIGSKDKQKIRIIQIL